MKKNKTSGKTPQGITKGMPFTGKAAPKFPKGKTKELPAADVDPIDLPENAFRELGADEEYRPMMHPAHEYAEVTPYSVTMGLLLAVIFSAAAAYLGLKVGQVFEAAIPIAIIAVGLSGMLKKDNALGQNVMIQSIGAWPWGSPFTRGRSK